MTKLEETFAEWRRITAWAEGKYPRWTEFEYELFDFIATTAKRVEVENNPSPESLALVKVLTARLDKVVLKLMAEETDFDFYRRTIPSWEGRKPTEEELRAAFLKGVPRKDISEVHLQGFPRCMTIAAQMDAGALSMPPLESLLPRYVFEAVPTEGPPEEEDSEVA